MSQPTVTPEQAISILNLKVKGWKTEFETLTYAIGGGRDGVGCVMINCTSPDGKRTVTFGIEPDGHTHS